MDVIGVSPTVHVTSDLFKSEECINHVFTCDCVNGDKTTKGRIMDAIGWNFDLDLRRVGRAKHLLLKTLHGFMTIKLGDFVTVKVLMKLASWASHYVTICRHLKPFNTYLHRLSQGLTNLYAQKKVDSTTYQIIQLWTMFLTLMNLHPTKFDRPFESFSPLFAGTFINLDASLTGIGILVYRVCMSGSLSLHVLSGFDTPYICSIVIQVIKNSMEFIAILCAIMLCIGTGISHAGLSIQGDYLTALS